ncbi:MAG TPA: wax ester/triacylglycerol synthase family O-acyltransferase [Actinomycetota bacterium]
MPLELLRPHDAFFLHTETARVQQHVGGLAILDPSGRPSGPLRLDEVAAHLAGRLDQVPRLRQRLAFPPLGLVRPAWVDDDAFDLGAHLRTLHLAGSGGRADLCAAVEAVMSQPLDRSRPLWEAYLIEGLPDGLQGFLVKLHHAIADGLAALELARHILDLTPDPTPSPGPPGPVDTASSPPPDVDSLIPGGRPQGGSRLFFAALRAHLAGPLRSVAQGSAHLVTRPRWSLRRAFDTLLGVWELARRGRAPRSPITGPIGPRRRIAFTEVPLPWINRIRRELGCGTSDIALTATAEALHRLLAARPASGAPGGGGAPATLRTMLPIAVRPWSKQAAPGTWTAAFSIDLPVGPMAPAERLAAVRALTRAARHTHQARAAKFLMDSVGTWAPAWVHARAARFAYRGRWFNLIVTALRGVPVPVYLLGARVAAAYPIMPLAEDMGFAVAALSWADQLTIGLTADWDTIPELDAVAKAITDCVEQLYKAAKR